MIPRSWVDYSMATPGRVLVRRDEVDQQYHGLFIPSGYQNHTRKALATVLDISPECLGLGFHVGDRVLLGPSAGRKIVYGYALHVETELWSVAPDAILARLPAEASAEWQDPDPASAARDWEASRGPEVEPKRDEGDPRGLR